MAKKEDNLKTAINKTLKDLLQERGINPFKIVVFGSYARGTEREDSDIDIVVVSKDFRNKSIFERVSLTTGIGRQMVHQFKKPIDLLFYSDKEWEEGNSLVLNTARLEGVTL
jgi:predicted nucleotidyltransferase